MPSFCLKKKNAEIHPRVPVVRKDEPRQVLPDSGNVALHRRQNHFFFNDTATTENYPLSLHDALPIWSRTQGVHGDCRSRSHWRPERPARERSGDRKSTRLNSSHLGISYAVFCLK